MTLQEFNELNIHKAWELIRKFEDSLLNKDQFNKNLIKRNGDTYAVTWVQQCWIEWLRLENVPSTREQPIKITGEEINIPKLEEF